MMVSLDVRNAFNTAPWARINLALMKRKFPTYLVKKIQSYLENQKLTVAENNTIAVTCAVPQGSVIGPTLWNVFYDDILKLPMHHGVKLIAYADDVAIVAHNARLLEEKVNPTIEAIRTWMDENGLQLAPQKSEAVLLTRKNRYDTPNIFLGGHRITVTKTLRYLGINLDQRLTFTHHTDKITKVATENDRAIARLMPNVKGPSASKRLFLSIVVHSKLLYAASVGPDVNENRQESKRH